MIMAGILKNNHVLYKYCFYYLKDAQDTQSIGDISRTPPVLHKEDVFLIKSQ